MQDKIIEKLHRKKKIDECLQKYVNLEEQSGSGKGSLGKEALKLIGLDIGIEALMSLFSSKDSGGSKMGTPSATFQMPVSSVPPPKPETGKKRPRTFATRNDPNTGKPVYIYKE